MAHKPPEGIAPDAGLESLTALLANGYPDKVKSFRHGADQLAKRIRP